MVAALRDVGLDPETRFRYPHEFSGGQRQRIAVARAIVLEPTFVVLDEPTSALDMLIQAQIVDLLRDLQKRRNLTYMFISHDLRVVAALASRLIVMRHGKVVEEGAAAELFARPKSDYTRALFAAAFKLETVSEGAQCRSNQACRSGESLHRLISGCCPVAATGARQKPIAAITVIVYDNKRTDDDGPVVQERDVLIGGKVVAVMPIDIARQEIVLIRQFRLPAHHG